MKITVEIDINPTKAELAKARTRVDVYENDLEEASKKFSEIYQSDKLMNRDEALAVGGAAAMLLVQTLDLMKKYQKAMKEYIELLEERNEKLEGLIPEGTLEER